MELGRKELLDEITRQVIALCVLEARLNCGQDRDEILEEMLVAGSFISGFGDRYYDEVVKELAP